MPLNPTLNSCAKALEQRTRFHQFLGVTFLPIVDRELRVASRRRGTYWSRTIVAMLVVGIGMWIYLMGRNQSPAEVSMVMFIGLTIVAGLFCLFAGLQTTADCLSEEKRDGTLGLLFLTDLRGYDVVAGKLVAGSLNTFYGLLASLPMLAIPLLMGGVTGAEFWRVTLSLVNTFFFSLAAGMFASSLSKSVRSGMSLCLLFIIFFAGLLPLTGAIIGESYNIRNMRDIAVFFVPSAGFNFAMAFEQPYRNAPDGYWGSLIIVHALAWAFLIFTCILLPRSWQDKSATVTQLRWRDRWLRWSLGNSVERARFRDRLLDINPFFWLASRSRIKPAMVWATIGVLGAAWIWGWTEVGRDWLNPGIYVATALLLNTVLKCWFAGESVAQLSEDRRIGALELLLSTPMEIREIMAGQFRALMRQFFWPVVFAVALEIAFMIAAMAANDIGRDGGVWVLMWIGGLLILVMDLWALFHVSLWQALTARSASRANTAALARILAAPWILYGLFLMLIAVSAIGGRAPNLEPEFFVIMWILIGIAVDLFFGLRAKSNLEAHFREMATARYSKPRSFWKWLFSSDPNNRLS